MEVEENSTICMTRSAFCVMRKEEVRSMASGVRAAQLFQANPSQHLNCLAIEIDPQTSTTPEFNESALFHVFVLKCENELACFALNGAKLELRTGDHLVIKPGCTFHFTNSSFSTPLKLRMVHRASIAQQTTDLVPTRADTGAGDS